MGSEKKPRRKTVLLASCLAMLIAGCATTTKVDWEKRTGSYTFDDAVIELGPPDKEARLTDGTRVAEWFTFKSRNQSAWDMSRGPVLRLGHWIQRWEAPQFPDYYMRLTFQPDGKLKEWKEITK